VLRNNTIFILYSIVGVSYNLPKFGSSASWNPNATTFANASIIGTLPYAIFVNINNTVYAADKSNDIIHVWLEGNMTPWKTIYNASITPYSLFVTINNDMYVDDGDANHRVDKWTSNLTNNTIAMYVGSRCTGLFVDLYDNIYCSLDKLNQVIKKSFNDDANTSSVIAGNGSNGSAANMLNQPRGIFVNMNFSLYVADCGNDRIQLFRFGQLDATTIAGNGATIILSCPTGIVVDADGYVFITDYYNSRIVGSGPNGFQCICACTGIDGSAANQLSMPRHLSFDSYGNIFVVDGYNNRIQLFLLATNSCGKYDHTGNIQFFFYYSVFFPRRQYSINFGHKCFNNTS
jgi:hypothetical protein